MGRKSTPKAEDVASVAVEAKPPKKGKRKAEEVIEKEGSMKKKQEKVAKEAEEVEVKTDEKKNMIKHRESISDDYDDDVQVVSSAGARNAVFAAKKNDRIWDDTDSSSDGVFDHNNDYSDSDSDSDVTEERYDVLVYIRDGCYMNEHLAQLGVALRRHLSSCGEITGVTVYGHPMNLERKARITFTSKEAVERALKFDQSKLLDGTPITVEVQGDLDSDSSGF